MLLFLDNSQDTSTPHPHPCFSDTDDNFNVMVLPPDTISHIQPMDQGVTAIFESHYLQKTFVQLVRLVTDSRNKLSMQDLWANFKTEKTIDSSRDFWKEELQSCMNSVGVGMMSLTSLALILKRRLAREDMLSLK
jgi:hypothetical protein